MTKWLTSLPARIAEFLLGTAILAYGGVVLGDMPVWSAVILALAAGIIGYTIGTLRSGRQRLYPFYAEHIREALEALQKILAGEIPGVNRDDLIEKGILGPARHWLRKGHGEDVRLMVIAPTGPEKKEFRLIWESGHSLEAREKFTLDVAGSFAGFAYTSGETQWSNDVQNDNRWRPHPKARKSREYGSLVSVPIRQGSEVVGVLSVVSRYKGAFSPGDLKYIEVLGSLINVVGGFADSDEAGEDEQETKGDG